MNDSSTTFSTAFLSWYETSYFASVCLERRRLFQIRSVHFMLATKSTEFTMAVISSLSYLKSDVCWWTILTRLSKKLTAELVYHCQSPLHIGIDSNQEAERLLLVKRLPNDAILGGEEVQWFHDKSEALVIVEVLQNQRLQFCNQQILIFFVIFLRPAAIVKVVSRRALAFLINALAYSWALLQAHLPSFSSHGLDDCPRGCNALIFKLAVHR